MIKFFFTILFVLVWQLQTFAFQNPSLKTLSATKVTGGIEIDGQLSENLWSNVPVAKDFTRNFPNPGTPSAQQTEVRVLYDDEAIYIGARMYDTDPDSIFTDLSIRDNFNNSDVFGVFFDTYATGLNGFSFAVSAGGVQQDVQLSIDDQDTNWDAVWESAVSIDDQGWIAELKIPFYALRFSDVLSTEWAINFRRDIRRTRESSDWSFVSPEIDGTTNQTGRLTNLKNINSPIRLSFTPYITLYANNVVNPSEQDKVNWGTSYNGGLDLKYGLTEAFTLDMTIIPDFGQVQSDNQVLNLSPFEVFFEENRQFFTEGIEIFRKGDIFYSRRVGGNSFYNPLNNPYINTGDLILEYPDMSQLINSTKISGRTQAGTGLGFFNSVEKTSYALVRGIDDIEREIVANPLTNYNVVVIDQNLKNNSNISFTNTNVWRDGDAYDANVSALTTQLRTPSQQYQASGRVAVSQLFLSSGNDIGHTYGIELEKIGGELNYGVEYNEESDNYNPNDLGFLFSPNERSTDAFIAKNWFEPSGIFNRRRVSFFTNYQRLYQPNVFTSYELGMSVFGVTKGFLGMGLDLYGSPVDSRNYFEPRTRDFSQYLSYPKWIQGGGFISTDYSKPIALDGGFDFRKLARDGSHNIFLRAEPRFRINEKLFFVWSNRLFTRWLDRGWVNKDLAPDLMLTNDQVLMGDRYRSTYTMTLSGQYIFTNKMSIDFRIRHVWDKVIYKRFGSLKSNGEIDVLDFDGTDNNGSPIFDQNFNVFNIDVNYIWRFAPGSDIIVNWKNQIFGSDQRLEDNYFENFSNLFDNLQTNSFSVRFIYFLDYNSLAG